MKNLRSARIFETKEHNAVSRKRNTKPHNLVHSPLDQVMHLQRTIGNQAVEGLFTSGVIQEKLLTGHAFGTVGAHDGQSNPGVLSFDNGQTIMRALSSSEGTAPAGPGKDECSGWLRDPESTSVVAAKHYVRTELKPSRGNPETVTCDRVHPDRFLCRVKFSDGTIIAVIARPDVIVVGVSPISTLRPPPDQPLCFYDYSCPTSSGELVLTKRECKSAKKPTGSPIENH